MCTYSGGGLFLRTSLAESLSIFHDLAMGETAATQAKRRWNAEGAGMPPLPNHRKNKGRRHQSEETERIYKTYEAVEHGIYHNPDEMISFDSESIPSEMLTKLRAEACKTPLKPSDKITFYTKAELRKGVLLPDGSRLQIPSPNLFDACVLSFDDACIINTMVRTAQRAQPIKPMGVQRRCR